MPSVFTRIIKGELPARFVWQDDICVAFLSINPVQPGHTLVVPRQEIDNWLDLEPAIMNHLFSVGQQVGWALTNGFHRRRVAVVIAGLEVPHAHVHLIPFDEMEELDFKRAREADPGELDEAVGSLHRALRHLGLGEAAGLTNGA